MPNLTLEIQLAPSTTALIEKLIAVLSPNPIVNQQPLPQTPEEQAARQRIIQIPQQPAYTAPVQSHQPAPVPTAPVNSTQAAPIQSNQTMGAGNTAPVATPAPSQPVPTAPSINPPTQAPTAGAPAYTYDDLARAASQLMDAGKQQELIALLGQFQVQSLSVLPKEQFGAFATALRQMGARV